MTFGEALLRDSLLIERVRSRAFDVLEEYAIEILPVKRGFVEDGGPELATWVPVFENLNSGIYLRWGGASFESNMRACAAYCETRGIPFSRVGGFDERQAFESNPRWAAEFKVQRYHMLNHRWGDRSRESSALRAGW